MLNSKIFIIIFSIQNCLKYSNSYVFNTCTSQSSLSDNKIVQTLSGPIRGQCYNVPVSYSNNSKINYDVFNWLSIPYAEPPINANRFLKPQSIKKWNETRDTLFLPKFCAKGGLSFYEYPSLYSEDCLFLNVFVRSDSYFNRNSTLKPIFVWIHGGSFLYGGTSLDGYEPSTLVAASDIIVVTIQYRLGVFGFLYHNGIEGSGNAGFLDQSLAIEWIYNNAEFFGGDKTRITIGGESAGAWSVGFHLFYPSSWPYFRNAIMESGGPTGESKGIKFFLITKSRNR